MKPGRRNPGREELTTAPDAPDARVLALDIGLYGHRGAISAMFWYQQGGKLHTHQADLLPEDATLVDQLDVLEAWAETYPEYWRISPVVVIGVTVLSPVGRQQVRHHLDAWYNPPWRRKLVSIGDYAGEQAGVTARGLFPRKKLRDHLAHRLGERTLSLTPAQYEAVSAYTGRRERPGRDEDDEWRTDETDAIALPVALSCVAAHYLLPPPQLTPEQRQRLAERAQHAWQIQYGLSDQEAWDRAVRDGHPQHAGAARTPPRPADELKVTDPSMPLYRGLDPREHRS